MMGKYESLQKITDWIKNSPSEEFMEKFNRLDDNNSGITIGDFLDLYIIDDTDDFPVCEETAISEEEYEQSIADNED